MHDPVSRVNSWRSWTYYQYWVSRWIWLSTWSSIAGELPSLSLNFSLMSLPALFPERGWEHVAVCLPPHYSPHFPLRCRREPWYRSSRIGRSSLFASVVRVPAVALALFFLLLLWQITVHTGAKQCLHLLAHSPEGRKSGYLGSASRRNSRCWQGSVSFRRLWRQVRCELI